MSRSRAIILCAILISSFLSLSPPAFCQLVGGVQQDSSRLNSYVQLTPSEPAAVAPVVPARPAPVFQPPIQAPLQVPSYGGSSGGAASPGVGTFAPYIRNFSNTYHSSSTSTSTSVSNYNTYSSYSSPYSLLGVGAGLGIGLAEMGALHLFRIIHHRVVQHHQKTVDTTTTVSGSQSGVNYIPPAPAANTQANWSVPAQPAPPPIFHSPLPIAHPMPAAPVMAVAMHLPEQWYDSICNRIYQAFDRSAAVPGEAVVRMTVKREGAVTCQILSEDCQGSSTDRLDFNSAVLNSVYGLRHSPEVQLPYQFPNNEVSFNLRLEKKAGGPTGWQTRN